MKEIFALVASLLAIAGNLPYLFDVLKGAVKPHPYTWMVWTIVSGIVFFGQIAKGAGIGALPTAASEICTLIIFILSIRFGFRGIRAIDTVFFTLALFGIGLWLVTDDPTLSVIIAVSIDVIAFVPTLRKTWHHPATEAPALYATSVLRHILTLLSLQTYNIVTTLHSIAMIAMNVLMTTMIVTRKDRIV